LKAINPRIVYCSVTGFGQTGPYAERAGYDYAIQGMGGLMSVTGERDDLGGGPQKVGVAVADLMTGMYATVGILAALRHAEKTGEGQQVDMALLDTPVAMLATLPLALVGRPDLPAADLPALIALARASSAGLTYATSGTGTSLHLLGEIIAARTGARLEHVPYRITSQIPTDLMGGRLDLAILALTVAAPLVRDGRIKGFAVSAANPHPAMPAVPPLASLPAMAGFEMAVWQGIFAPARTDAAIVERLAAEIQMAMEEPETQRRLAGIGMTASQLSLAALGRLLRAEMTRYEAVVRAANIRLD
jgi:tripartite-type tricarboxylate transporter receptor subunit TctC